MVTMEDIAQAAGVAASTVARAIHENGYVALATREKILRVAEELNYTVNTVARSLATGRTGVVAVISGRLDQIRYANVVNLLESHLTTNGYQMKLLHTRSELKDLINATRSAFVDGVINSGMHTLSNESEFIASSISKRCVFLDTFAHENADYVRCDMRPAVTQALELMMAQGRQRIAYVGMSDDVPFDPADAAEDRLVTYLSVMEKAGRPYEYISVRPQTSLTEQLELLVGYFQKHGCPDGMICLHDELAIVVNRALKICGFRVPDDALLVGCGGLPQMEFFDPPISSVVQPMEEMSALAWQFLQARMADPQIPLQQATFSAKLEVRESLQHDTHA